MSDNGNKINELGASFVRLDGKAATGNVRASRRIHGWGSYLSVQDAQPKKHFEEMTDAEKRIHLRNRAAKHVPLRDLLATERLLETKSQRTIYELDTSHLPFEEIKKLEDEIRKAFTGCNTVVVDENNNVKKIDVDMDKVYDEIIKTPKLKIETLKSRQPCGEVDMGVQGELKYDPVDFNKIRPSGDPIGARFKEPQLGDIIKDVDGNPCGVWTPDGIVSIGLIAEMQEHLTGIGLRDVKVKVSGDPTRNEMVADIYFKPAPAVDFKRHINLPTAKEP